MVARRHWLSLLTLAALLVGPFALAPRAVEAQTTTYIVDNKFDLNRSAASACLTAASDGDCSLREAITKARQRPAAENKIITFQFADGLSATIPITNTAGALPALNSGITVQGPALGNNPLVAIVGSTDEQGRGTRSVGFRLAGNNNTLSRLALYGFDDAITQPGVGAAIEVSGDNNQIIGNYIGLTPDGTLPAAGQRNLRGVRLQPGADNNLIGYDFTRGGLPNTISGNSGVGLEITDGSRNLVSGNYIGIFYNGSTTTLLGNGSYGIQISSSSGVAEENQVGGDLFSEANVIGGNSQAGLRISGTDTVSTTVVGNFIGGFINNIDIGNSGDGIQVIEARATQLAGTDSTALLASGNNGYGVFISNGASGTTIAGRTLIGVNYTGNGRLTNGLDGVYIGNGAAETTISGNGVRIAGNTGTGVRVDGTGDTAGVTVSGALIGVLPTTAAGIAVINDDGGVLLENGAAGVTLSGNTISGNGQYGVRVSEAMTVTLTGNFIGLNRNQTGVLANGGPGVAVYSSTNTLIGGSAEGSGNYIGGNAGPGVVITGTGTLSTTVDGNTIGLRRVSAGGVYTAAAANGGEGVLVQDGPRQTTVGDELGNIIGGAAADASGPAGVRVLSSPALPESEPITVTLTTVRSNTIGAIPNGTQPAVDRGVGHGIVVEGAGVSQVEVVSNTVRLNAGDAVRVSAAMTVTVGAGNLLANNDGRGVFVNAGATDVQVISNTIQANVGPAVRAEDVATRRVTIRSNELPANGDLVELAGTTLYNGTPPDTLAGPNHDIDPPFNLRVTQGGLIRGQIYTSTLLAESALSPVSACVSCTIQVFSYNPDLPLTDADAWKLLAFDEGSGEVIVPDSSGNFSAQLAETVPAGQLLFAATDGYGNTSQFAAFEPSAGLRIVPLTPPSAAQSAAPGDTVTYTLRIENTGSLDLNNVRLTTSGTLAGWIVDPNPAPAISLPGLGSQVVTYTLTLPTGSAPGVRVPITDVTTVTALANLPQSLDPDGTITDTQRLTTTVLAAARLRVAPVQGSGSGKPNDLVTYSHTLFNEGNITMTVNLATSTRDAADSGRVWSTALSFTSVTLGPGEERVVALNVTVPSTAQQGASATHYITATVVGEPSQTRFFSDTTRVDLDQRASMFSDERQDGLPGGKVIFRHTVLNLSNAPATFKLNYQSNLGSTVQFFSETPGVTISPDGTFTISNVDGSNVLLLRAEVTVEQRLLPGEREVVNIFLTDPASGESIGGAAVVDEIDIRGDNGVLLPRLWLPMIFSEAGPQ